MKNLINKRFTLADLTRESGADPKLLDQWRDLYNLQRSLTPESLKSGRTNYILIQDLVCQLSNGHFKSGGQGKGRPDFYYQNQWGETKGYEKGTTKPFWVAASAFFGKNSKAVPHRELLSEGKKAEAKKFLFEHSYNKNKFYLLTSTTAMTCEFDEIEMMFIETDVLKSCLLESKNYTKVCMTELCKKVGEHEQC